MDRRYYSPHDPYNSCNSNYGSYDSSHDHFNSSFYRSNDYPMQYGEAPPSLPRQQSHSMFTFPCSFCKSRMHMANDCYHLHGVVPPIHQQWSGQRQMGDPYFNTSFGWNAQQDFRREEDYNCDDPSYQWEPPSQFRTPNLPNMTTPIQHSPPPSDNVSPLTLKEMTDSLKKLFDEMRESIKATSEKCHTPKKPVEQHLQDFVLQPAHSLSEQQNEVHDPSFEKDSEDEDEIIIIDDVPFPVTIPSSSPPCDGSAQQCDEETPSMHNETGMHDFDPRACDEHTPSTPLHVSICTCGSDEPCEDRLEIDEWIAPTQSSLLNSFKLPKVSMEIKVLEPEEEQEESSFPPEPTCPKPLDPKIEEFSTPLIVEFVIPSHSFHISLCIYDYISFCDIGVKGTRTEEQADQREGRTDCSLQRRHLLPLWIFRENLKPD